MKTNNSIRDRWITTAMIKKFPVLMAVLGLLAVLAIPAFAGGPPEREGTWGNDQQYIMLMPKIPVPAAGPAQEELYVIGAVDASHPQSQGHDTLIGPHDHVVPIPAHNSGEFSAIWRAFLIVPGPNATATNVLVRTVTPPIPSVDLVYAADLNGDGTVQLPAEQLTSVEKIEQAEALGLVAEIDTGVVFVCPIVKAK